MPHIIYIYTVTNLLLTSICDVCPLRQQNYSTKEIPTFISKWCKHSVTAV